MDPVLRVWQSTQSLDRPFCGCYALTLESLVCVDPSLGPFYSSICLFIYFYLSLTPNSR